MVNLKNAELVAPAGNLQKLKVAIEYGADAVYLGGKRLSLRARAENFSRSDLAEGLQYARERGVRVYVLLNVFPHNQHLDELREQLEYFREIRPDALVVSDIGAFELAQEIALGMPIHISTQANVTNWRTARFWERMGASRLILAREVSLKEVSEIASHVSIGLEIFVHGAMCMAYSGRCFMSTHFTGRDANLGDCAQPCRWTYRVVEETRPGEKIDIEEEPEGTSIFSSRDLCMIEHLPEVLRAGVCGLKIEGRMKSAYYLGVTVRAYRTALDAYYRSPSDYHLDNSWLDELKKTSNRAFTTGFYLGEIQQGLISGGGAERQSTSSFLGIVMESDHRRAKVEVRGQLKRGDRIDCIQPNGGIVQHSANVMLDEAGNAVEVAQPNSIIYLPIPLQPFTLIRR